MYAVILVILALFGTLTLIHLGDIAERTKHISMYHIIAILVTVVMMFTLHHYNNAVNTAYEDGYNDALYEYNLN